MPNAHQNLEIFALDPFGDDFFCKLCFTELSNLYMHCNGCEELLKKDFNICMDCHSTGKFKRYHPMCSDNNERDSLIHHTGDMTTTVRHPTCQCERLPRCLNCQKCTGCSCTCHTQFTLNFRFMGLEEEVDLLQRVTAVVKNFQIKKS